MRAAALAQSMSLAAPGAPRVAPTEKEDADAALFEKNAKSHGVLSERVAWHDLLAIMLCSCGANRQSNVRTHQESRHGRDGSASQEHCAREH